MNSNTKTFGQNPNLTWSKESDEWKVNDELHEFLDDPELPNWALKALKSSPEKDYEDLYDERPISPPQSDLPMQSTEDHLQQTTQPAHYPYPYVNQQYQQTPSNQNFHEIKGPSSRSHSELSMSIYPSSEMNSSMNQAIRDAYNPSNERNRGYSYGPVNYKSNGIPCSLNNYNRNNVHNFQGDAFSNDVKNGCYQNNWDQRMEMLYRHGTMTQPMNIYTPGHHLNNYQRYDNNCLQTAYHQPAYHSIQDGLMHSQSRPVMSTQPHQNRMFFSHQQAIHPYQVYHSSVAQGPLPERCIPFSAQYGNNFASNSSFYNPEMSDYRSLNSSKANVSLINCFQSTKTSEQIQASNSPMQQNIFAGKCQMNENNNNTLPSNDLQLHPVVCNDAPKQPDSIVSHSTATTTSTTTSTTQKQEKLDSDVQETLVSESKLLKDQSICETGKPNIPSATPKESPKPIHREAPNVDTRVSNEKDDRSPVAYTILFSAKDETVKPPELSDKRFLSRARSQDRFTSANKLSEVRKPNTNFNSRNVSAKTKAEKNQPENRDKAPRRSRASVKSETPQPSSNQMLSQSFNESSPRGQLFQGRSSKLSQLKKPSTVKKAVEEESLSDSGDFDAVSESGTYVVDSENSLVKTFRDEIPDVFGIDLDDIDDVQYTFKRSFSQKPKVSRHKSSGTSVDYVSQKKKVSEAALENISTSSLSSSDKFPSRRLLPEAPATSNVQEKVAPKKKPSALPSEKGDIISKWLNKSFLTNKPPPSSTNCFYSARSGLSNDKDDSLSNRQSRRSDRTTLSNNKIPFSQREIPKRDATPFREISGRRSVDPQTSSVRTRVARMNINSSFGDGDDLNVSSQMSKSLVSNYEFTPFMSRPVRPRSTSRPRQSKSVAARKLNDLSSDSLNDSKSGTDLDTSTFSKTRPSVSDRLCAPTIATELKSKKSLNFGETAPTTPNQSSLQSGPRNKTSDEASSLRGSKRKIVRSKTLDCEEFLRSESHKTPENKHSENKHSENKHSEKRETLDLDDDDDDEDDADNGERKDLSLKNGEAVEDKTQEINMSQKVAKLTKKYLMDLQELLKDGNVESGEHSAVEEMLSHLKEHTFVTNSNDNVLGTVTELIKSQSSASDNKNIKALTKKFKETTF